MPVPLRNSWQMQAMMIKRVMGTARTMKATSVQPLHPTNRYPHSLGINHPYVGIMDSMGKGMITPWSSILVMKSKPLSDVNSHERYVSNKYLSCLLCVFSILFDGAGSFVWYSSFHSPPYCITYLLHEVKEISHFL